MSISTNLYVNNTSIFNNSVTLISNLNVLGTTSLIGGINVQSSNIPNLGTQFNNISWSNNLGNVINNSDPYITNIRPFIYAQQINLSSSLYVYKQYYTNYPNTYHKLQLYIKATNDIGNVIFSVTDDTGSTINSSGIIFTSSNGINSSGYNIINWLFTPPTSGSGNYFRLYIGNSDIPNLGIQSTNTIYYHDLIITPINGNINTDGVVTVGLDLIVNNNTFFYGNNNIYGNTIFSNSCTFASTLNVSSFSYLSGPVYINNLTIVSTLNVSGNSIYQGNSTYLSQLNISGITIMQGNVTLSSKLNVNSISTFYERIGLSRFSTSQLTYLDNSSDGQMIFNSSTKKINIFYNYLWNEIGDTSRIVVTGTSLLRDSITAGSSLNVSGVSLFGGNSTFVSNLNVSGNTLLNNNIILNNLPNYDTNYLAKQAGIPIWGLYRTGGIIKILLDDINPSISLIGNDNINIAINLTYNELGVTAVDDFGNSIIPVITSIVTNDLGQILLGIISLNNLYSYITTNYSRIYTITYTATDVFGNYSSITRTVTVM
jgi:hypothetical protein